MAKGDKARERVVQTIVNAFGSDCVGIKDKKIYVWAFDEESNENLQFAITITKPKTPIEDSKPAGASSSSTLGGSPQSIEVSEEDRKKIQDLKKMLGITVTTT